MKLLELKSKLEKGKALDGEVVYIKEDSIVSGIGSVYKDQENKIIALLKCKEETIKAEYLIKVLDELYASIGDREVIVCNNEYNRELGREVRTVEFAQYDLIKMLFINI